MNKESIMEHIDIDIEYEDKDKGCPDTYFCFHDCKVPITINGKSFVVAIDNLEVIDAILGLQYRVIKLEKMVDILLDVLGDGDDRRDEIALEAEKCLFKQFPLIKGK